MKGSSEHSGIASLGSATRSGLDRSPASPITLDPPVMDGDLGSLHGRRIIRMIGQGSTAAVYESIDPTLDRHSALKILLPTVLSNRRVRVRFLREAKLCAKINHPHVVTIYRSGELGGMPFIEMELIAGATLEQYLRKKRILKPSQVIRFARELLDGLATVHAQGIVHRDLKPGNIWLSAPHGKAKLLDFGLAHVDVPPSDQLTMFGAILGTPSYMSPEQARGRAVDARSDLFSFGIILYQMLTGALPFVGQTPLDVITAITVTRHRTVQSLNPSVPESFSLLIDSLLEKNPDLRPKSVTDVRDKLIELQSRIAAKNGNSAENTPLELTVAAGHFAFDTKEILSTLTDQARWQSRFRAKRHNTLSAFLWVLLGIFFGVAGCAIFWLKNR